MTNRKSLPPGSIIEFVDIQAVVVHDDGGNRIKVRPVGEDVDQIWLWTFEGTECRVISEPAGTTNTLRELLLKAIGEATAFRMLDENSPNQKDEIVAAKETGKQLERTLLQIQSLLKD